VQEVSALLPGECMNVAVKHPADIATMLPSVTELAHKALEASPDALIERVRRPRGRRSE
jgi:hypothetical protein